MAPCTCCFKLTKKMFSKANFWCVESVCALYLSLLVIPLSTKNLITQYLEIGRSGRCYHYSMCGLVFTPSLKLLSQSREVADPFRQTRCPFARPDSFVNHGDSGQSQLYPYSFHFTLEHPIDANSGSHFWHYRQRSG